MYKKRKLQKLKSIGEDTTIKLQRKDADDEDSVASKGDCSEENIPFSQEHTTQRYLSQRSILAATLPRTQSRNVSQTANSYFELLLQRTGVKDNDADSFMLSCDVIFFVNKVRETLMRHPSYPENLHTFKSGLRMALSPQSTMLQKLLTGCTIASSETVFQSQDSMLVNLLMIDFLRSPILDVLLEKIENIAIEETSKTTTSGIPILSLLLTQLQHLRHSHVEKIFPEIKKILTKAKEWARWEIIMHAEFILDACKHDDFAQLILDMFAGTGDIFKTTTIQAFISLSLSMQLQAKIRCKILAYIKDGECQYTLLPILIKFILKVINDEQQDETTLLIKSLREILIEQMPRQCTNAEYSSVQLEIFACIAQSLKRSRKLYLLWQKIISNNSEYKYRAIDFIMLLIFVHIREDNSLYINNILRRGIKSETINLQVIKEVRSKYFIILEHYATTLMQVLNDFLREKHAIVLDFARYAYEIIFDICDNVQRDIISKLLDLTFDKKNNLTTLSLKMLRDLQAKYPKEIQNHGTLLLPLLDRLNEMTISQTRITMDILCSIAYPPLNLNECPLLQEQIDMLIKKQLINRTPYVKKQGIIGSVQLINSIASTETTHMEINDCNVSFNTMSDLPDGRGKIAANYISRVESSALYSAEALALFYDELASIFAVSTQNQIFYDKSFLAWMCEMMTYNFQNNFICENISQQSINGFTLSAQKCINTRADTSSEEPDSEVLSVAINIGELALRSNSHEASSSIIVLGPLFKLTKVLNSLRNEGSLQSIDALLGCAIILPNCFEYNDLETRFLTYDDAAQRKVLDMHYHCINWMRETVSSFATQCEAMIRQKVLQRLTELIQIENKLRKLLEQSPINYVPPMSQFIVPQKTINAPAKSVLARGRKAKGGRTGKSNMKPNESEQSIHNETNATHFNDITINRPIAAGRNDKAVHSNKTDYNFMYGPKEIYRQMDSDLMLILREKLCLEFPMPPEKIGSMIGLQELHFILTDLVGKVESVNGISKFESDQAPQYIIKPHYFMNDLSKFLTVIVQNMQMLSDVIATKLSKVGGVHGHQDLFNDECSYIKACFGLSLRLLAVFFNGPDFLDKSQEELLKDSMLALLERNKALEMRSKSCAQIAAAIFTRFVGFEPCILELRSAAYFYNLLLTLQRHATAVTSSMDSSLTNDDKEQQKSRAKKLRSLCKTLLCRKWYAYDCNTLAKGTTCNYYLDEIVKGFLKDSDFNRQKEILNVILEEVGRINGKDVAMHSFPNIRKANFPILFRGLCEALLTELNKNISANDVNNDRLKIWEESSTLLNMQLEIVQRVEGPRNFQPFLKYSHLYLKLLLQHGLPVIETKVRQNPERISTFLKGLQITTRFLHNLCVHSKAIKQLTIISQIPFLRETIENLVFRVKALLAANKCSSVFWMGSLKNKDLHGDEVLSQRASLNVSSDEEEIPEDDTSVNETIFDQNELLELGDENSSKISNNQTKSSSSSRSKCI